MLKSSAPTIIPVDLNDPSLVLYLPLWYPADDMTGSTIYSYGKTRYTGTVTGAVWNNSGIPGRYLDGNDDKIEVNCTEYSASRTVICWFKSGEAVFTSNRYLVDISHGAKGFLIRGGIGTSNLYGYVYYTVAGTQGVGVAFGADTGWHMATMVYTDTVVSLSIDGGNFGSCVPFASDTVIDPVWANTTIGANTDDSLEVWLGNIGEVIEYSRAFSLAEKNNMYDALKWRYK